MVEWPQGGSWWPQGVVGGLREVAGGLRGVAGGLRGVAGCLRGSRVASGRSWSGLRRFVERPQKRLFVRFRLKSRKKVETSSKL